MTKRPTSRPDVVALEGYHSPQMDVAVRLNTNESPLPPPAEFADALAEATRAIGWNRYPDRGAGRLRTALAERYGVGADQVFAANGSNEVIQSLLMAYGGSGRSVAVFEPTYAMYAQIARFTGTRVVRARRDSDFALAPTVVADLLDAECPDLVVLCSPNNPTGTLDPGNLVSEVVEAAGSYGGLVVVDEAYGQFAPHSAVDLLDNDRNLVVSRTFSKTWAMAGARIGYLLGPSWCVAELEKVALPYHLDAFKQVAGELALAHGPAMDQRISVLVSERER
ncbi:MAG: aminotransferase class I/II-fold pyridoxal phosphate-dependent enzyme, partial [Acidimicrobiales bacterium]|nr:aminotransferase class I/II-fold pyridoxal phosphate-dependent enzyme [Acidimicrobiales bacterium]